MKKIYGKILLFSALLTSQINLSAQCGSINNLGTSSNMFTMIRNCNNPIAANKNLNTIAFIHRNNATAFGGNSGQLRFDLSTNGGANWTNDVGVMNPICTNPSRYPNVAIYNPVANTNTANVYLSYLAPTISTVTLGWANIVASGVSQLNGSGATETYNQNGIGGSQWQVSSLVNGAPGQFWAIDISPTLGFNIYKGSWNNGLSDIVWNVNYTAAPTLLNATTPTELDYNIAFDPTGMIGYFNIAGHLSSGPTAPTLYPILYKTIDGGVTWTGPIVVDITKFSCVTSNVVSGSHASMTQGSDLIVDVNGNPHIITSLGSSSGYIFNYSQWHHMYDITLSSGLWVAHDLGNANCGVYTPAAGASQWLAPHASRTADGTKVFFTWADNATATLGSANSSPDLFGKALNISTGLWTATKNFSSCNPLASGKIYFPHIAPEVLEPTASSFLIPTIYGEFSANNDPNLLANFKYLNNVTFATTDFSIATPPAAVTIQQAPLALVCPGSSLTINVAGIVGDAIWNTGANSSSLSITSGTATSYSVVAQVGCNTGTASIAVTNVTLNASTVNTDICPGESANFLVTGNALGYTWTPGNVTGNNVTIFPTSNIVTLTAMGSSSCTTTETLSINILPVPTLSIAGSKTICATTVLSLSVTGAQSYVWSDNSVDPTFTATPLSSANYSVIGTAANSCTNTQTVSVFVLPSPTVNALVSETVVCVGKPVSIIGSGAITYSLNGVSSPAVISVTPNATSSYSLTGAANNLCENTRVINITVNALPSLTITAPKAKICKGEKIKLTASGANTYNWSSPGSLTSTMQVGPVANATYSVTGTSIDGCVNTQTFALVVDACLGLENIEGDGNLLIYPNPNNGQFMIQSVEAMEFIIFNELGQFIQTFSVNENGSYEVSLKNMTKGIYFISGKNEKKSVRQKIVVSN